MLRLNVKAALIKLPTAALYIKDHIALTFSIALNQQCYFTKE
nr:MAG TPA: hypothetical protein [Caudoviricetes sp.]